MRLATKLVVSLPKTTPLPSVYDAVHLGVELEHGNAITHNGGIDDPPNSTNLVTLVTSQEFPLSQPPLFSYRKPQTSGGIPPRPNCYI